jgi:YesN/AraC family two-component response regulator
MDGLQLLTTLRTTFPDLNFILLSGYEHLTTAQIAIAAGACTFLEKPLDPGELKNELRNCVSRSQWAPG